MSVFLTNDELALFAQNGFDPNAIQNTVNTYRNQGLSDDAIRAKIDTRLADFNKTAVTNPEEPTEKQESMPIRSGLQSVGRGAWGSFGINANKLNAAFDATTDYVGNKLAKNILGGDGDIIPADSKYNNTGADREATWRDYYNRSLNKEEEVQKRFEQKHPFLNVGLEIVGSTKGAGKIIGKAIGADKAAAGVASKLAPKVGEKIASVAGKAVGGALSGGAGGALYGFGTTNGDINERLKGALRGGTWGTAIGGALPVAKFAITETGKGLGKLTAEALGKTSGAGAESVERAYDAGMRNSQVFKDAMRGKSSVYDVVDDVDKAVRTMEQNAGAKWQSMLPDKGKTVVLPDTQFKTALNDATKSISGVTSGVDDTAAKALNKVHKLAQNVKANGGLTFENAQEAKKAIDGIIEPLKRSGEKNAVRLLMPIKNALTDTMEKAIPEYGGARAAYAADMSLISKIKNALTSNDPTTELRKLQGITRQSVAAAQGGKQELGKVLDAVSNGRILDAIAGGQVQQLMPRDALRIAAGATSAVAHPTTIAALPIMSPRAVGEGAYWLGQKASKVLPKINAVGQKASNMSMIPIYKALGYIKDDKSLD